MSDNVLYICGGRNFYSGNLGRKIAGVVTCWRKLGYKVKHVCGGDLGNPATKVSTNNYGAQIHHNKWYRKNPLTQVLVHTASEYRDIKHDARIYDHIERIARSEKPFLIWERSSRLHKAGLDLAKKLNVPFVLEWKDHLVPYSLSLFRGKALAVESLKNSGASYIVVESQVLKDRLAEEGVEKSKILVALNAIEPEDFIVSSDARCRIREQYGVEDNHVLIGYLGSYAFYHDTKRLILAVKVLVDQGVEPFKVLMVGNGKEFYETRDLARDLGLADDYIFFHDAIDKQLVPDFLSALDVAVLPGSTDIICPIKVQEYMYMGLPTVIPDYVCNQEVIENTVDGMLFDPRNELSLADSLKKLIESPDKRAEMGKRAKNKAEREFTWEGTWGAALKDIETRVKSQKSDVTPNA